MGRIGTPSVFLEAAFTLPCIGWCRGTKKRDSASLTGDTKSYCSDSTTLHKRFAGFVASALVSDAADAHLFPGDDREVKSWGGGAGGGECLKLFFQTLGTSPAWSGQQI